MSKDQVEQTALLLSEDDDDDLLDTTAGMSSIAPTRPKLQINPNANTIEYTKVSRVQNQINSVVDTMKANVSKVIERGENLDELNDKSEQILSSASVFQNRARGTRRAMWMRTCRGRMYIGGMLTVIVVLLISLTLEKHIRPHLANYCGVNIKTARNYIARDRNTTKFFLARGFCRQCDVLFKFEAENGPDELGHMQVVVKEIGEHIHDGKHKTRRKPTDPSNRRSVMPASTAASNNVTLNCTTTDTSMLCDDPLFDVPSDQSMVEQNRYDGDIRHNETTTEWTNNNNNEAVSVTDNNGLFSSIDGFEMSRRLVLPKFMLEFFGKRSTADCFDKMYYSKMKLLYAPEDEGKCVCELKIDPQFTNVNSILHGGLIASLVDSVSTAALYNSPLRKTGVSVNMNISYMKAARLNETVLIDGSVLSAGNKLVYLAVKVYLRKDGNHYDSMHTFDNLAKDHKLIATGDHTKYIL